MGKYMYPRAPKAQKHMKEWKIIGTEQWRANAISVLYNKLILDSRVIWQDRVVSAFWHISIAINSRMGNTRWIDPTNMAIARDSNLNVTIHVGVMKIVIVTLKVPIEITFYNFDAFIDARQHIVSAPTVRFKNNVIMYKCDAIIKHYETNVKVRHEDLPLPTPEPTKNTRAQLMSSIFKADPSIVRVLSTLGDQDSLSPKPPMTPEQPPMSPKQSDLDQEKIIAQMETELLDNYSSYMIDYYAPNPFSRPFAVSQ